MKNTVVIMLFLAMSFCSVSQNKTPNLKIAVDQRIELLSIFLHYTDWPYFGKFDDSTYRYYNDMRNHFDKYSNHKVFNWFGEASKNWNLDDLPTIMMWVSNPPDMKQIHPFPLHRSSQLDTVEFKLFIKKLNEYAEDTRFIDFWNENQTFYSKIEKEIEELIPYNHYLQLMIEYYGSEKENYVFIPAPLFKWFSCGPLLKTRSGEVANFISCFNGIKEGEPYFTEVALKELIFHEYGHSYVNPTCYKYWDEIFEYEYFYEYMNEDMKKNSYHYWFSAFHEHIVRSGEYLLLKKAGLLKEAENNYSYNLRKGFYLLPFFVEKLEYYENHRDVYKTFEEFFPHLLDVFQQVKPIKIQRPIWLETSFMKTEKGAEIRYISERSPYSEKLKRNDVILMFYDKKIRSEEDIDFIVDSYYEAKPGDEMKFKISRDNEIIDLKLEIPFEDHYIFKGFEDNKEIIQ